MSVRYAVPPIVTNGLVLYLDAANRQSYVSGSTTWYDATGNGLSGSLINGPTFNSGSLGSINFDGVDDYVGITGIQTPSFSILAWINLSELNRNHGIMGRAASIWGNVSYSFRVVNFNGLNIVLSNSGDTTIYTELSTTSLFSINTWYQVVATFAKPNIALYVNGSSQATGSFNYDLYNSTSNSIIGGYTYGNGLSYLMKGQISNIQFYNRALTAQEVQQNYNATKARYGL